MDCCWVPCLTAFLVGCFATTKSSTFSDSWSSKITWMVYQWQFVGQWWSMVYHGRLGNPPFLVVETSGVSLARFDGNPRPVPSCNSCTTSQRCANCVALFFLLRLRGEGIDPQPGWKFRGPLRPSKSMLSLRKSRIGDSPGDLRSFQQVGTVTVQYSTIVLICIYLYTAIPKKIVWIQFPWIILDPFPPVFGIGT